MRWHGLYNGIIDLITNFFSTLVMNFFFELDKLIRVEFKRTYVDGLIMRREPIIIAHNHHELLDFIDRFIGSFSDNLFHRKKAT